MNQTGLNLARAWRSRSFDEIIGQELVIRLLKNSLFKNYFFPVYLLAGQRGSGKTTTARVFATALNCELLGAFQKNPQKASVPCLTCHSCLMMREYRHPDFIEIDAASHTGVDNIRALIEGASFLPVLGRKKVYLVDEAHMLSKAAFNAFLKILEEPPLDVLFLLATTDPQKVIDTVSSRCFKLFFDPIKPGVLINYLRKICEHEQIKHEEKALALIVQQSDGSARDALNTLERVRLATEVVSEEAIGLLLKLCNEKHIVYFFECLAYKDWAVFLSYAQQHMVFQCEGKVLWKKIMHCLQALMYVKHTLQLEFFSYYESQLQLIAANFSLNYLMRCMELCYEWEPQLHKTLVQGPLVELLLLKMFVLKQEFGERDEEKKVFSEEKQSKHPSKDSRATAVREKTQEISHQPLSEPNPSWSLFLESIKHLEDPLLLSIFSQALFKGIEEGKVILHFSTEFTFFQDLLNDTKKNWYPLLQKQFDSLTDVTIQFVTGVSPSKRGQAVSEKKTLIVPQEQTQSAVNKTSFVNGIVSKSYNNKFQKSAEKNGVILTDLEKYPTAQLLLRFFPGTITEIKD